MTRIETENRCLFYHHHLLRAADDVVSGSLHGFDLAKPSDYRHVLVRLYEREKIGPAYRIFLRALY